jgi:predicted SAM-dependent methyltransferase
MKIHLACGTRYIEGCINIDYSRDVRADFYLDIGTQKQPFGDNSASEIYLVHAIEHLNKQQGRFCLEECKRVLMPGGKFYIVFPDIRKIIDDVFNRVNPTVPHLYHDEEWLITAIFETQENEQLIHKYGYTEATMRKLLFTELNFKETHQTLPENQWFSVNNVKIFETRWAVTAIVATK